MSCRGHRRDPPRPPRRRPGRVRRRLWRLSVAGPVTDAAGGRTVAVSRHERHLANARLRQQDHDWQADYRATRPKVERKIAHLVRRRHGGRRARVRGIGEVDADFNLLAAAVNVARLAVLGLRYHPTVNWTAAV